MVQKMKPVRAQVRPFDRFIPYRPFLDVDESNFRLRGSPLRDNEDNEARQYQDSCPNYMSRLLNGEQLPEEGKVLPFTEFSCRRKFDTQHTNHQNIYRWSPATRRETRRRIPSSPDCVMDMPGIRDDFYTNLLDWGHKNLIAVALHQSTFIWHAESKECQRIEIYFSEAENDLADFFITALRWDPSHDSIAIADNAGDTHICDVVAMKTRRKFGHAIDWKCSVGSLLWTENQIVSGNARGEILFHDLREHKNNTVCLSGHRKKAVCGLTYKAPYLASGGDDGCVNIWDLRMNDKFQTILAHTACAKALAWCPWRTGMIASGGGCSDGYIRLWNVNSGEKIEEAFTKSQVCSLLWSHDYMELVSSHGTTAPEKNDIVVWDMKQLKFEPLACLRQHTARPLHLSMNPDGTTIASAGADEALCLWKLFPKKTNREKTKWESSPLNLSRSIR